MVLWKTCGFRDPTTEMFRLRMNSFLEKQFDRIVQMQFLKGNQFPIGITICRVNKRVLKPDNSNKALENFEGKQIKNEWFTPCRPILTKFTKITISHSPEALQKLCITVKIIKCPDSSSI